MLHFMVMQMSKVNREKGCSKMALSSGSLVTSIISPHGGKGNPPSDYTLGNIAQIPFYPKSQSRTEMDKMHKIEMN